MYMYESLDDIIDSSDSLKLEALHWLHTLLKHTSISLMQD